MSSIKMVNDATIVGEVGDQSGVDKRKREALDDGEAQHNDKKVRTEADDDKAREECDNDKAREECDNDKAREDNDDKKPDDDADDEEEDESEDSDDGKLEISDTEELTSVFNSSSRRKKTIHNYVAPMHMREQTLRFIEYPTGVWIDEDGRLCPDDRRSDIFRIVKHAEPSDASEISESDFSDDSSSSEDASEPEVNWKDELDVKHLKRANKKVHVMSNDEVIDGDGKSLSDDAKRDLVIRDLSKAGRQVDAFCEKAERAKKQRERSQKLIRLTQKLLDEWAVLKRKAPGNLFKMKCDAKLVITEPSCEFVFTHVLSKRVLNAKYDCAALHIACECGHTDAKVAELLAHFMDQHICNVE
jgi:hypothetical protein